MRGCPNSYSLFLLNVDGSRRYKVHIGATAVRVLVVTVN